MQQITASVRWLGRPGSRWAIATLLSALFVGASFIWQGHKGINFGDEGILWYGSQGVLLGEVPLRDFMSYDPGRYYWAAFWMHLLGDGGIMNLRIAVAIFQVAGLATGLFLLLNALQGVTWTFERAALWLAGALTLLVWMFPRHKLFDLSISIFMIGWLTWLIRDPTTVRALAVGICVGLAAVFGRNHGVYAVFSCALVFAWIVLHRPDGWDSRRAVVLWGLGVVIGFSPVLGMAWLVPDFGPAFVESIAELSRRGATNIPLSIPWPWTVRFTQLPVSEIVRGLLSSLFFMSLLVFAASGLFHVFRVRFRGLKANPVLVACSCAAIPYAHYAFSRADLGHLAHGVFPMLIGCFTWACGATRAWRQVFVMTLLGCSAWVALVAHPGWQCRVSAQCVPVSIGRDILVLQPAEAASIDFIRNLAARHEGRGGALITPTGPGMYPILGQRSPMWEVYALLPQIPEIEDQEIERIRRFDPGFVIVFDYPLDGRDEMRFPNTHPRIWKFLGESYQRSPSDELSPVVKIFLRPGPR